MTVSHDELANSIRALAMDAVEKAKSGHPGMPMGMADVATVLFTRFLKFDPSHPKWPDRDRFVLSAGHGSMLLYALLYLTGYPNMDIEQLKAFRQLGSRTPGHPEYGHAAGIETTTGPLGQGLANSVGMALGERHADRGRDALAERTGGGLDALGVEVLGMARGQAAELAELLELIQRHAGIAGQIQQRIEQHRAVAGREHEAVAVGPVGDCGVEFQELREQHRGDVGGAHR